MSGYVKLAIAALLLAAVGALGYFVLHWYDGQLSASYQAGQLAERTVWQQKEVARTAFESAATQKRAEDNAAKQAKIDANNLQVQQDHEKAVSSLRQRIAALDAAAREYGGLRIPTTVCTAAASAGSGSVPAGTQAASPGRYDAWIAATVALPDDTQRHLRASAHEADAIVEDFRTVQEWAVKHGFMPAPPDYVPPPILADPPMKADTPQAASAATT
ncbi:hypothetical protein LA345_38920 (plasmid) [Burkholderia vietnamiensis]|uniref:Uncharacterized protein n=1 Tax=Burkholderia vietnamiensis (strain G4 / LMG 22486) TaxID=269482 RepID=A4JWE4_BURVG|nr:hypothetical protein Bcep1808_7727 [Burkholderia vietnamiensis G4]MCB4349772.1 hypothetical protein [Burkholderia vietnamiensis]